jgi:hypothetical protein
MKDFARAIGVPVHTAMNTVHIMLIIAGKHVQRCARFTKNTLKNKE